MGKIRPRVGTPEWRARFHRDQQRFDRVWPWWLAFCILVVVLVVILVILGVLPAWLLLI